MRARALFQASVCCLSLSNRFLVANSVLIERGKADKGTERSILVRAKRLSTFRALVAAWDEK